ncbi:hypothetical protein Tco_0748229 [Tanacetum coccineum]|uniref:Uncharacterized protein n=1 Tax=Tanacetum coccineum TaxID=301880 RepID=A0ABQ4YV70_9ASTR
MNIPHRICKFLSEEPEQEKIRNRFPLKMLLQQNLESYKGLRAKRQSPTSTKGKIGTTSPISNAAKKQLKKMETTIVWTTVHSMA